MRFKDEYDDPTLLGLDSNVRMAFYSSDEDADVTTWCYRDDDTYETVVEAFGGGVLRRLISFHEDDADHSHQRMVEQYLSNEETEGDSCHIGSAARFAQYANKPWRPSFALAGFERW